MSQSKDLLGVKCKALITNSRGENQSMEIKEFYCDTPGDDLEATPKTFNCPEWLDVNHPDFPKYFQFSVYSDEFLVKWWIERKPKV